MDELWGMSVPRMSINKAKKQSYRAVLVKVKEEMAKPRIAQSAQQSHKNNAQRSSKEPKT
jgi:hypothetical protein